MKVYIIVVAWADGEAVDAFYSEDQARAYARENIIGRTYEIKELEIADGTYHKFPGGYFSRSG